ncbi:MAG: FecR domain-containing protein [Bacteroidota bacterium]
MTSTEIENIIVKYLLGEASSKDMDFLTVWIQDKNNEPIFDSYVKTHFEITANMNKPDVDLIKEDLLKKIEQDRNPFVKTKFIKIFKYAAVIAVIFSLGYLFNSDDFQNIKQQQKDILIPGDDAITIELEDGSIEQLDIYGKKEIRNSDGRLVGTQDKSNLTYQNSSTSEELVYNTLYVPNGKRFDVVLSDGTHIYLNSGSSLKYPVRFIEGNARNVFLYGEAYFDVAEDKAHPFVVNADDMNVQVLGTKFNISHFPEHENINTVLVEGSVEIYDKNEAGVERTLLKPGFMAEWNKSNGNISVENVDTRLYTAWLDGKLIYRNDTFKSIRYSLERHYNIMIKNENKLLDEQRFDATFDIETINEVLEAFNKSYAIDYEVVNNKAIIK